MQSISSTSGARILSNFFHLALDFHDTASRSRPPSANLPTHILSLSTACRPPPTPSPSSTPSLRYELRTERIESDREWTPQRVFEELVKGRSPVGEVWLDSARVRDSRHLLSCPAAHDCIYSPLACRSTPTSSRHKLPSPTPSPPTPSSSATPPPLAKYNCLPTRPSIRPSATYSKHSDVRPATPGQTAVRPVPSVSSARSATR